MEKKIRRLIIQANNIHIGGGETLLRALLDACAQLGDTWSVTAYVDRRMRYSTENRRLNIQVINPTIFSRLWSEIRLSLYAKEDDSVLCFGNLPPLLFIRARVRLFIQNTLLLEDDSEFPLRWASVRITLERYWMKMRISSVEQVIVQTPSMCDKFRKIFPAFNNVSIYSFLPIPESDGSLTETNAKGVSYDIDFLYVGAGEPHKNHKRLIDAWGSLASIGHFPVLALTLDEHLYVDLIKYIESVTSTSGAKILNLGWLPKKELESLYKRSKALIYPSLKESFGIPLLEAAGHGLDIIASELDYVRDVVDPAQTFNPLSELSIARGVQRYLNIKEVRNPVLNPVAFLKKVLEEDTEG